MDVEKLEKLKQLLDSGVISEEEFEQQKREVMTADKKKSNIGLILGVVAVVFFCAAIIVGSSSGGSDNSSSSTSQIVNNTIPTGFEEACPVNVSSSMYDNIIGMPELKCTITNNSTKSVAAVKLHFDAKDVYGEKINSIFIEQKLFTDDEIAVGDTVSKTWQMLDQNIKSGDLYVYSVYFTDGSEWGNKDAPESEIRSYGYKLTAKY